MRIAIDARELTGHPTGVGRYLAGLLTAWHDLPEAAPHEFLLCAPAGEPLAPGIGAGLPCLTAPGRGTRWEQATLPGLLRRARADLLFAPGYTGPLRGPVPMVVTVHDVSFAASPRWFGWREGLRRRVLTRLTAHRAVRVLTVSEFSKREIVRHLRVPIGKVEAIYPGVTTRSPADASPPLRQPLVLYVGSIFNRRHVPALADGFLRLTARRPDLRLELVGDNRTRPRIDVEALARHGDGRIHVSSWVDDDALAGLYARASAFAFLSEYEGFGLTPLEALAHGVPIVVLDTEVAREIYGPAALYVARPDPALVADALARVLFDPAERARQRAIAPQVLARYTWRRSAALTLAALLAAGSRTPQAS